MFLRKHGKNKKKLIISNVCRKSGLLITVVRSFDFNVNRSHEKAILQAKHCTRTPAINNTKLTTINTVIQIMVLMTQRGGFEIDI